MKRISFKVGIFLSSTFIISFLFLFNFSGCSSDSGTVVTPPNVEVEASTIKVTCEFLQFCATANSYLIMVYNNQQIPSTGCPTVTINTQSKSIKVDYGSVPCVSGIDSVRRSGHYTIQYYTNVGTDSIAGKVTFTNYRIYRSTNPVDTSYMQISGDDDIGGKRIDSLNYRVTYVMNNNFLRDNGSNGNANLTLNVNAFVGAIGVVEDDVFTITGSGTMTNGGSTFAYNIFDPNDPIMVYGNCRYPKSGKVMLSLNNNDYTIDFFPNNGACDAIAAITKSGVTVIVDLSAGYY